MERERFEVVVLNSEKTRAIGNGAHILSLYSGLEVDVIDTIRGHSLICFFFRGMSAAVCKATKLIQYFFAVTRSAR